LLPSRNRINKSQDNIFDIIFYLFSYEKIELRFVYISVEEISLQHKKQGRNKNGQRSDKHPRRRLLQVWRMDKLWRLQPTQGRNKAGPRTNRMHLPQKEQEERKIDPKKLLWELSIQL